MPIQPGFSAIELLLVAGIISLLVAIAVPNYMEAKIRAEVSDVKITLQRCENALIQYKVGYNRNLFRSITEPFSEYGIVAAFRSG